jgi:large subunit ribosomal protein L35
MKNKTHKGLLKRIRITKTGKVRHRTAGHKHLRSGKGGKKLRQMRRGAFMADADAKRLERLLFRRLRGPSPVQRRALKEARESGM